MGSCPIALTFNGQHCCRGASQFSKRCRHCDIKSHGIQTSHDWGLLHPMPYIFRIHQLREAKYRTYFSVICMSSLCQMVFIFLKQDWFIVKQTLRNKIQWNLDQNYANLIRKFTLLPAPMCEYGWNVQVCTEWKSTCMTVTMVTCISSANKVNALYDKHIHALHDDVIKWKHFPCYWPFVRGIHRSPVNSPHKGQWRGALMFSLICALNKLLGVQTWGWLFEMPSLSFDVIAIYAQTSSMADTWKPSLP